MKITLSSGNVYADLNILNPEDMQKKSRVVMDIGFILSGDFLLDLHNKRHLNMAAEALTTQGYILTKVLNGHFEDIDLSKLESWRSKLYAMQFRSLE